MTDRPAEPTEAMPTVPPTRPEGQGWVLGGRYRVLDRLGSGGMAEVFRAHDEQLDREVAVKVFRTQIEEPGNAGTPERRERELRALAQLSHPHLITLFDANAPGTSPSYLVTELVRGPSLAARLAEGPLPEPLARSLGTQIADALGYVHALGMVHRDVKPANILLGSDGADGSDPETAGVRARLADFGIVRLVDSARLTAADFTLGTASYLAPEQARGANVDQAADIYSLGLVLIEALTGRRSFDGPMHEALAARLAHAPEVPPGLPQPWPGLLTAMTSSDPALRPSAAEVAAVLRTDDPLPAPVAPAPPSVLTPLAVSAASMPSAIPEPPQAQRRRRHGAGLIAAALACLAIIGAAVILLMRPASHPATDPGGGQTVPSQSVLHSGADRSAGTRDEAPVAVQSPGAATQTGSHGGKRTSHTRTATQRSTVRTRSTHTSAQHTRTRSTSATNSASNSTSSSASQSSSTSASAAGSSTTGAPANG